MAAAGKDAKGGKDAAKGPKTKPNNARGTQDELEVLRLIVLESTPIRTVVMERLRQVKIRAAYQKGAKASARDDGNK